MQNNSTTTTSATPDDPKSTGDCCGLPPSLAQTEKPANNEDIVSQSDTDAKSNGPATEPQIAPHQLVEDDSAKSAEPIVEKGQKAKTRKSQADEDQSKWVHNLVLESGQWLKLKAYENNSGSWSFRVEGHLPPCQAVAPEDLVEMLKEAQSGEGLRRNTDDRAIAKAWIHDLEQICDGVPIVSALRRTRLSEAMLRKCEFMVDVLSPYFELVPEAIDKATALFVKAYANLLSDMTMQELVRRMVGDVKGRVSKKRRDRFKTAINNLCKAIGYETKLYDSRNKILYDIHIGDVTRENLKKYISDVIYKRVISYMPVINTILNWGVENGYFTVNPAAGLDLRAIRAEIIARKSKEIPVNTIEEVQIALNMAAEHRGGIFMPQIILLYFAALRPDCELLTFKREFLKLHKGLIRLFSTKNLSRRIIYLAANAIAMLRHYWPKGELRWDGWDEFEQMVHAAQGYQNHAPAWFKKRLPPPTKGPYVPDLTRHTGLSNLINWEPNLNKAGVIADNDPEVLKRNYDGLVPKEESARYYAMLTDALQKRHDTLEAIRKELDQKGLLIDGQLPVPLQLAAIDVNPPEREYWLPPISDDALIARLEKFSSKVLAEEYGITQSWFLAICRAKNIRMPKCGRSRRLASEMKVPLPPLVDKSNAELEAFIKAEHGVIPAARKLRINSEHLTAYCVVNGIPLPSQRDLALHYNSRKYIHCSPLQIKEMLAITPVELVVKELNVTRDHFEQFCARHGIIIPEGKGGNLVNKSVDSISAALQKDIANRNGAELKVSEAIELALKNAPQGLTHDELIAVLGANGIQCTVNSIRYTISQPGNGRIRHVFGRVCLVKPSDSPVNLEQLKADLAAADLKKPENILEAIKRILAKAPNGLEIDDLLAVLPSIGFDVTKDVLMASVRRYKKQVRLEYYHGVVTVPDKEVEWKPRVRDQEATPQIETIKIAIQQEYNTLASKTMTNVELMEFILSKAPQGLWQTELIAIAVLLGIDFKESCIHSVVHHEAQGRFVCQQARVLLVGPPPSARAKLSEIQDAVKVELANGAVLDRNALIARVLRHFPHGLSMDELMTAVRLAGHHPSRDTLRRKVYVAAKAGAFKIENGQVTLPAIASQAAA